MKTPAGGSGPLLPPLPGPAVPGSAKASAAGFMDPDWGPGLDMLRSLHSGLSRRERQRTPAPCLRPRPPASQDRCCFSTPLGVASPAGPLAPCQNPSWPRRVRGEQHATASPSLLLGRTKRRDTLPLALGPGLHPSCPGAGLRQGPDLDGRLKTFTASEFRCPDMSQITAPLRAQRHYQWTFSQEISKAKFLSCQSKTSGRSTPPPRVAGCDPVTPGCP